MAFRAFRVEKNESGFVRSVIERNVEDLPEGDVLIDVQYSSLNYKDALSATGNPGVTRVFPHTPGIDAAGSVLASTDTRFAEGDAVVVIGFDLGMGTSGGFAERIRVPANWVVKLPEGLTARESMLIGTAGFTAAECVQKLEQAGMTPDSGPILVTGATGGVGSVAVKLLATLGYEVAAVTGKPEQHDWLRSLGASELLTREAAAEGAEKPLLAERWGGVVDTVGGDILFNGVKSLRYGCSLAACGLVAAPQFGASVLPFILRHVNLLGIDSVQLPLPQKTQIWSRLATDWKLDLSELEETLSLHDLSAAIDRILAGQMVGRGLVDLSL
ncbi:MAG: YhdH/YhfP family quinone oxidoreductase [Pseudomonadota bacterium]|nr:YhdH/YhfP family quinone oxidoreductase [Pseudomonadota bacterium]